MQTQKIGLSSFSRAESANSLYYDNQWSIGEKNFVVYRKVHWSTVWRPHVLSTE